jgi:hypothetical protein
MAVPKPAGKIHKTSSMWHPAMSLWSSRTGEVTRARTNAEMPDFNLNNPLIRRKFVFDSKDKKKGVIAESDSGIIKFFLYYPKPEHFERFYESSRTLLAGYRNMFPGSVGAAALRAEEPNRWILSSIQAHFKTDPHGHVNRSLATNYGGWRERVLECIFEDAKKSAAMIVFEKEIIDPKFFPADKIRASLARRDTFRKAAKKNGMKVIEDDKLIYAIPENYKE